MKRKNKSIYDVIPSGQDTPRAEFDIDRELELEFGASPRINEKKSPLASLLNVRGLIFCAFAVVFVVCAVILVGRLIDYTKTDEIYKSLADEMFREVTHDKSVLSTSPVQTPIPSLNDYNTTLTLGKSEGDISENTAAVDIEYARIRAKLEQIKAVNDDIIGWIRIEGTEVNYPVVVGDDNEYYLTHAYNGEYLRSGTIFADYQCSSDSIYDNRNTVLYGHNMANGSMFAAVKNYFRNNNLFETTEIYFYGFDGIYVYEPVMLLDIDTSFYYYQVEFFGRGEYEQFLSAMFNRATYKKDVTLTGDDKLLTLSTCTNRTVTGRYVLQARLVRMENTTKR